MSENNKSHDRESDSARVSDEPIDPIRLARRDLKKALPRRFYETVAVASREPGFTIEVDGRAVRTPAKAPLVVPSEALAARIADEWRAQDEWIEPDTMPLTRLVNSALDGVAKAMAETAAETAKFAESDLVCYRAAAPAALVAAQAQAWDPVLSFARDALAARFICVEGVIFRAQPSESLAAVRHAVDAVAAGPDGALRLAALNVMTTLAGSVLLALAVVHGAMSPEQAWAAANVDEDFQMETWGSDSEALSRRARRWRDMESAVLVFALPK